MKKKYVFLSNPLTPLSYYFFLLLSTVFPILENEPNYDLNLYPIVLNIVPLCLVNCGKNPLGLAHKAKVMQPLELAKQHLETLLYSLILDCNIK